MGLSNRKEEQLKKMPNIETRINKSADGKFMIHQTIITHVKPTAYYQAILNNEDAESTEANA